MESLTNMATTVAQIYSIFSILMVAVDIYAIVLIYKMRKLVLGKGNLWSIIPFVRWLELLSVVFNEATAIIATLVYWLIYGSLYFVFGIYSFSDAAKFAESDPGYLIFFIVVTIICIMFDIFYIGVVFAYRAKYLQAKSDLDVSGKDIEESREELKKHFLAQHGIYEKKDDSDDDPNDSSDAENPDIERDDSYDNGYYDDGL